MNPLSQRLREHGFYENLFGGAEDTEAICDEAADVIESQKFTIDLLVRTIANLAGLTVEGAYQLIQTELEKARKD
jgi:hypothetical protein